MIIYGLYHYFFPQEKPKQFRFCNLPKEMQNCVVSNLSFREFASLAATCREFKNILKLDDHNHQISCYLKSMLREVKVLNWSDVEGFRKLNNVDITFFFSQCLNLNQVKYTSLDIISLNAQLNDVIIKSCPTLKEFMINSQRIEITDGAVYDLEALLKAQGNFLLELAIANHNNNLRKGVKSKYEIELD